MKIEIKEYSETNRKDLEKLFSELQSFERSLWPDRAEPTEKFIKKLTDALLKEIEEKQGVLYLAFDNNYPCGFVGGYIEEDIENQKDYFRIDSLVVTEKYRGLRVGSNLVEKIELHARNVGQSKIGLGVLSGNVSAYKTYQKLGFKDYGIEMIKDLP